MTDTRTDRAPRRPNIRSAPTDPYDENGVVISIDPGHTTGVAWYKLSAKKGISKSVEVRQFKFEHLRDLVIQVRKLSPPENPATIVYERYVTRPTQHGNLGAEAKYQLSPVYVHGYLVGAMEQARFPSQMPTFHPQLASEMSAMPDNRLKAMFPLLFALTLGPAKPHGRDALRHLLVYLKRYRNSAYQGLKVPQDIG